MIIEIVVCFVFFYDGKLFLVSNEFFEMLWVIRKFFGNIEVIFVRVFRMRDY